MLVADLLALFSPSVSHSKIELSAGETVFRQGDDVRGIFGVETGRIKLERPTVEGRESILHVAIDNECFAESSLFATHYHCNATATTLSRVILFDKQQLLDLIAESPSAALQYIAMLSCEVQSLRSQLELSTLVSARERVHQYLIRSVDPESRTLVLTGTLKELSARLGLAHETLYRELKKMEDEGLLERHDDRLILTHV